MIQVNLVPRQLRMLSRKDYTRALYAVNRRLQLSQIEADKIIQRWSDRLWTKHQVNWISSYNSKLTKNKNAKRECEVMGQYTLKSARGGHRRGYHSIQDVIANVRKYS
jgi:hypothetical protein